MNSIRRNVFDLLLIVGLALGLAYVSSGHATHAQTSGSARNFPVRANALLATVVTVNGSNTTLDTFVCHNPAAAIAFVQLFNVASATTVTLGTTVPTLSIALPIGGTVSLTGIHMYFSLGLKAAATTTATGLTATGTAAECNFGLQ